MSSQKTKKKQQKKTKKHTKAALQSELKHRVCPCCKKQCSLAKPKCSKGEAVRAKLLKKR